MSLIPVNIKHAIQENDIIIRGKCYPEELKIIEHKMRSIVCVDPSSLKNKRIIFNLRSNGHYVQYGYYKTDESHTLYTNSSHCCVCSEECGLFLKCGKIHKHYICDDCLVKTAALNYKKCPECRAPFSIPKRLYRSYILKLEKEKKRLNTEIMETNGINEHMIELMQLRQRHTFAFRHFVTNAIQHRERENMRRKALRFLLSSTACISGILIIRYSQGMFDFA